MGWGFGPAKLVRAGDAVRVVVAVGLAVAVGRAVGSSNSSYTLLPELLGRATIFGGGGALTAAEAVGLAVGVWSPNPFDSGASMAMGPPPPRLDDTITTMKATSASPNTTESAMITPFPRTGGGAGRGSGGSPSDFGGASAALGNVALGRSVLGNSELGAPPCDVAQGEGPATAGCGAVAGTCPAGAGAGAGGLLHGLAAGAAVAAGGGAAATSAGAAPLSAVGTSAVG